MGSFDMLALRNSYHGSGLIGHGTWTYNSPTVSPCAQQHIPAILPMSDTNVYALCGHGQL